MNIALPPVIQEKPMFGAACNGCGLCCAMEVCKIGLIAHGESTPAPCPSLVFRGSRFWCEFVLAESAAGLDPLIFNSLAIGRGCDADHP